METTKIYKVIVPLHYIDANGIATTDRWGDKTVIQKKSFYYSTIERAKECHPKNLYGECRDEKGKRIKEPTGEKSDYEYYEWKYKFIDIHTNEIVWSDFFWKNEKELRSYLIEIKLY